MSGGPKEEGASSWDDREGEGARNSQSSSWRDWSRRDWDDWQHQGQRNRRWWPDQSWNGWWDSRDGADDDGNASSSTPWRWERREGEFGDADDRGDADGGGPGTREEIGHSPEQAVAAEASRQEPLQNEERFQKWRQRHGDESQVSTGSAEPVVLENQRPIPLSFDDIHSLDLGNAQSPWPTRMCAMNIQANVDGNIDRRFGILTAPTPAAHASFGLSLDLEGCSGTPRSFFARFLHTEVEWPPKSVAQAKQSGQILENTDPTEFVQNFHDLTMRFLFGQLLSEADARQKGPLPALLVRMTESGHLDWEAMDRIVAFNRVNKLFEDPQEKEEDEEEDEDEEDWGLSCGGSILSMSHLVEAPVWLRPLLGRWFRLYNLQAISLSLGPELPVLDPLAMESFLTMPCVGFPALCHIGNKVLKIFASLDGLVRVQMCPDSNPIDLDRVVEKAISDCLLSNVPVVRILAGFLIPQNDDNEVDYLDQSYLDHVFGLHWHKSASSGAVTASTSKDGRRDGEDDQPDQVQMLKALVGILSLCEGGGFYACWRVLRWLLQGAADHGPVWFCKEGLEIALGYHCFGTKRSYKGRTPTFSTLTERSEADGAFKVLKVSYENKSKGGFTGDVEYRRSADGDRPGQALERISLRGPWTPLSYSPNHGTFLSTKVLQQKDGDILSEEGFKCSAVPNKVASWLFGKPLCAQVRPKGSAKFREEVTKTCEDGGLEMEFLQERLDGKLWVSARRTKNGMQVNDAELALNYNFGNRLLLLEAFSFAEQDSTCIAPNSKLACLGALLLEIVSSEELARKVQIPIFTTKPTPLDDDGLPAACDGIVTSESYVVSWVNGEKEFEGQGKSWAPLEKRIWPGDSTKDKDADSKLPVEHAYRVECFKALLDACNNTVAHAFACVSLGLHKFIGNDSAHLIPDARKFASLSQGRQAQAVLPSLMRQDAPRFLGELFAACAAAVFLDSDWTNFRKVLVPILEEHLFCLVSEPVDEEGKLQEWVYPQREANRVVDMKELTPTEISKLTDADIEWGVFKTDSDAEGTAETVSLAERASRREFHVFEAVRLEDTTTRHVMATSPRSAKRRCAFYAMNDFAWPSDEAREDPIGDDGSEGSDGQGDAGTKGSAIYCEECEMWLNGPTQWEDHKIGKKHKKKTKKAKDAKAKPIANSGPPQEAAGKAYDPPPRPTEGAYGTDTQQGIYPMFPPGPGVGPWGPPGMHPPPYGYDPYGQFPPPPPAYGAWPAPPPFGEMQ